MSNVALNSDHTNILRKLVILSIVLAFIVIALGAYTRLTHAGLGCPDWPTCYGQLDVPKTAEQIAKAELAFPERPVEPHKAWNEMIHRYFAGALGLFILAIAFLSFKNRHQNTPLRLPLLILAVVIFQAVLGMWTVTMMLMPIVVMAHLLGGFTTLSLLFLLHLRLRKTQISVSEAPVKKYGSFALLGIIVLVGQIGLGGWTSSHYAALSCVELPICQPGWQEQLTFENSFDLVPPAQESYEFGHLPHEDRVTIHVTHRFGAIITTVYLTWLMIMVYLRAKTNALKVATLVVGVALTSQVLLGISNIVLSLPLGIAVAHNVVAACLMLTLINLTYRLYHRV
ncbi:COX15/CtaA family protein [Colwellia sp. 4_MG-2023]|jgi:cytochrome c oxidase assembly protein subunit 15|uniref:COX15/CtaA family protein n=1 Tax=unclassified Colwellia TaxID=196834 RepID=UPI001C0965EE|nr:MULTISPECIES: COX15/CtaA family protein [unclassified Colwellia]MBU2925972.1 COX15/CtaA family protein [Colwellia sp. C2M11]MDO6488454.1 COX15/CtaA family protein [Colwellia sp. 6_MG-2023]MDO6507457.1 COX15/CtaA family protein [Colwellia sp. 5_MG-2023]MDO6556123.1 COX15/CtaA family protein [Colwellia sp. 4_MG-2023]MDO6652630.1 COX15/CtaA family protein [Colwellia sp. 3_MG-2023]